MASEEPTSDSRVPTICRTTGIVGNHATDSIIRDSVTQSIDTVGSDVEGLGVGDVTDVARDR